MCGVAATVANMGVKKSGAAAVVREQCPCTWTLERAEMGAGIRRGEEHTCLYTRVRTI